MEYEDEQKLLKQWFYRHKVKPTDATFRKALQIIIDAKELDESIPWFDMVTEFIPKRPTKPVGYQKSSDLARYLKSKKNPFVQELK